MSYITDKWYDGEIKVKGRVCGWYFEETQEFRPLMSDAMAELVDAGLVTQDYTDATKCARDNNTAEFLDKYAKNMRIRYPDDEALSEMRAEFGNNTTVMNMITGEEVEL
jgi:hypothetical protein